MLDGARLYVDVVEINPPLILWLNLPIVAAARALDLEPALAYRLGVLALLGATLALSAPLLRRVITDPGLRHALLLLAAVVLLPMADLDFGEREHLMLALILPYLWLTASRTAGSPPPVSTAAPLGVLAGVGLALKPHFLLGFLAMEWYRRKRAGRLRAPTPESIAVLAVLLAYAVAVLLVAPRYLWLAGALGPAYARFLQMPVGDLLLNAPGLPLTLLALLGWLALRPRARHPEVWDILVIASLAFFVSGLLQLKGLRYHFYPAFALATLGLGGLVLDVPRPLPRLSERIYRLVGAAAVIAVAVVATGRTLGHAFSGDWGAREDAPFRHLTDLVRREAGGEPVFVFSYNIGSAFPLVTYAGVENASRFPQLWIVAAEYVDRMRDPAPLRYRERGEMSPAERYLNEAVLSDLMRTRPRLLLVLRNARDDAVNGLRRFDYLAYFGRDPRFARVFAGYELRDQVGEYAIYRRMDPGEARAGPAPAATPGSLDVRLDHAGERTWRPGGEAIAFAAVFLLALLALGTRRTRAPAA